MYNNFKDLHNMFGNTIKQTVNFKKIFTNTLVKSKMSGKKFSFVFILKIAIVLLGIYILFLLYSRNLYQNTYFNKKHIENFQNNDGTTHKQTTNNDETFSLTQSEKYVEKKFPDLFDDFYVDFYDDIMYDNIKNRFELENLNKMMALDENKEHASILDVGSGTGHHINLYNKNGMSVKGLELSKSMIKRSKENYPEIDITYGDATDMGLFDEGEFTHIQCLYFTIYYMNDKRSFLENCFKWLKPGGYFAIHLVDRLNFDPIVNTANPLFMVSPQKYAKKRITSSAIQFKGISYKANFDIDKRNDQAKFTEVFKDDTTGKIRKNIHEFYMPKHTEIVKMVQDAGFTLKSKLDLVGCQYEYQYIYVFYKPSS